MDETTAVEEMKDYMNRHELTQSDFARLMGVCPSAVSHWFSGTRRPNTRSFVVFLRLIQEEKNNGID